MSPNTQEPPKSGCWPLGNGGTEARAFVLDQWVAMMPRSNMIHSRAEGNMTSSAPDAAAHGYCQTLNSGRQMSGRERLGSRLRTLELE